MARTTGWHVNLAVLAAFQTGVDKELVLITQAVMIILFGSCPRSNYFACRPEYLAPFPQEWGLHEIGPLRLDGLASYYKNIHTVDPEEAAIIHQKRLIIGRTCSLTAKRRRWGQLRNGGPVRVYVL